MRNAVPHILLQAAPPTTGWLSLDNIFWLTVLVIFLVTIATALLRRLSRDKCLKLFHEYHVAFFAERRPAIWGDCLVFSQGLELRFDTAFVTRRKLMKSSALLYEDEVTPMVCVTRCIHRLSEQEIQDRKAQIERTFHPNWFRRRKRWLRNILNTMRDAITKTITLVIGRVTAMPGSMAGAAISTQAGDLSNLTGNMVNLAANAYEPILERYIGQPVVLEFVLPNSLPTQPPTAEFPGYLVEYTQKFIAVFNVDHTIVEEIEIKLEPGKPASPDLPDLKITLTDQDMTIKCEGQDAFVLRNLCCGQDMSDLGITMIPGTSVVLAPLQGAAVLQVERTRHIDIIVPRTRARIRFGSVPPARGSRRNWLRVAPILESRITRLWD